MDGPIAKNANLQYSNELLKGAQQTSSDLFPRLQENIQAAPSMAQALNQFNKAGTAAAMMESRPATAYGYNAPQAAALSGLLGTFAPSGINMAGEKPLQPLMQQVAAQQGLNNQQVAGQAALAKMGLQNAELNNQILQSPINQMVSNPSTSMIPYQQVGSALANIGNYYQMQNSQIDKLTSGAQQLQARLNLNNQMADLGIGVPQNLVYDPQEAKNYANQSKELGFGLNIGLTPNDAANLALKQRNEASQRIPLYQPQINFADKAVNQLDQIKAPISTSNFMKSFVTAVTKITPKAFDIKVTGDDGKPTTLRAMGITPDNIASFDIANGNKAATKALLAGAVNPLTQQPAFSPQQIENMTNADGTINNKAAKTAFEQYKDNLQTNATLDRISSSDAYMNVFNNGMKSGGMGGALPQDVTNSLYKTYQSNLDNLKKNHPEQAKIYEQYGPSDPVSYYNEIMKRVKQKGSK
jgi:hypothetical protein